MPPLLERSRPRGSGVVADDRRLPEIYQESLKRYRGLKREASRREGPVNFC
jgi:hypothetical protein